MPWFGWVLIGLFVSIMATVIAGPFLARMSRHYPVAADDDGRGLLP